MFSSCFIKWCGSRVVNSVYNSKGKNYMDHSMLDSSKKMERILKYWIRSWEIERIPALLLVALECWEKVTNLFKTLILFSLKFLPLGGLTVCIILGYPRFSWSSLKTETACDLYTTCDIFHAQFKDNKDSNWKHIRSTSEPAEAIARVLKPSVVARGVVGSAAWFRMSVTYPADNHSFCL